MPAFYTPTGLGLKAAWKGAELFGDAAAALSGKGAAKAAAASPARARSVEETVASIRADYDRDYFISGDAEMAAYADNCEFSDDFAAFGGAGATQRFKKNVANLGGLLWVAGVQGVGDSKVRPADCGGARGPSLRGQFEWRAHCAARSGGQSG
jgi:hypothetical protein